VKSVFLSLAFVLIRVLAYSQAGDSATSVFADSTLTDSISLEEAATDRYKIQDAPDDSVGVQTRSFNSADLKSLKEDPNLNYKIPPTIAESLWDRFIMWLWSMFEYLFDKAANTRWGNVLVYALLIGLLVVLVMMLLKVNAFKILFSPDASQVSDQVLDENIHEMDFDDLIQEAISKQDYRRGIRLLFLYSLKLLSDKHLIHWETGKTNHEYVAELKSHELKTGLNELSFYFDYAWYGNFSITAETFGKAQNIFTNWRTKVR
jgi:hypothetical protein